jgi:low temperature requirement protein LtrA
MSSDRVGSAAGRTTRPTRGVPAVHVRMTARDTSEPNRSSSALEALYDLVFVVAVSSLVPQLVRRVEDGKALAAIAPFLLVFFAIWWAWINFTWFASAYDTDDVLYRVFTVVQMAGVLVLAAGVPPAFDRLDFSVTTIGYVVMRVGQIAQWVRAAIEHPRSRPTSLRYIVAVSLIQLCWVLRQSFPQPVLVLAVSTVLQLFELLTPVWAQRAGDLRWHPHHIAERYGLFVIILLGESVLAAVSGMQASLAVHGVTADLVIVSIASLVLVVALWWAYFLQPAGEGLERRRDLSLYWGYGHFLLFAALAAVGAGLDAAVQTSAHAEGAHLLSVGLTLAVPTAIAIVLTWVLHAPLAGGSGYPFIVAVPAAVLVAVTGVCTPVIGIVVTVVVLALVTTGSIALAMTLGSRRAVASAERT